MENTLTAVPPTGKKLAPASVAKDKLNKLFNGPSTVPAMRELLEIYKDRLGSLLPDREAVGRMREWIVTILNENPKLRDCSASSVLGGMMTAASLNLMLNHKYYGHCSLIPYGKVATFQMEYKGKILLMTRTGFVANVFAENVYEGDEFELKRGTEPGILHKPDPQRKASAKHIGTYAVAQLINGFTDFIYLPKWEIDRVERHSKGAHKPDSPWKLWPDRMWLKTAVNRLDAMLPKEPGKLIFSPTDSVVRVVENDGELAVDQRHINEEPALDAEVVEGGDE